MVVLWHLRQIRFEHTISFGWFDAIPSFGNLGVDVFFILSGFILSYVYRSNFTAELNSRALYDFALARVARLYPLHIAMLVVMLCAEPVGEYYFHYVPHDYANYTPLPVIANLLLVQQWFGFGSPNSVAWSISVEVASYMVFPVIIFFSARLPKWWPILGLVIAFVLASRANSQLTSGMAEFLVGFCGYSAISAYPLPKLPPWLTLAALVAPFFLFSAIGHEIASVAVVCFTFAILGIAQGDDWLSRISKSKPVYFLGKISYSIYMTHWFIWVVFRTAITRLVPFLGEHPFLLITVTVPAILAVSSLTYRYLEVPARRALVRAGARRLAARSES